MMIKPYLKNGMVIVIGFCLVISGTMAAKFRTAEELRDFLELELNKTYPMSFKPEEKFERADVEKDLQPEYVDMKSLGYFLNSGCIEFSPAKQFVVSKDVINKHKFPLVVVESRTQQSIVYKIMYKDDEQKIVVLNIKHTRGPNDVKGLCTIVDHNGCIKKIVSITSIF